MSAIIASGLWLILCAGVFGALQAIRPIQPHQPLVRKDTLTDIAYWFLGPLIYGPLTLGMLGAGLFVIHAGDMDAAWAALDRPVGVLAQLPILVQVVLLLLFTDFIQYWLHRAFHGRALWRFHAVHHSPEEMDFLHAVRFHPVNVILYSVLANCCALWVGFDPLALVILAPFNTIYSSMVHANLDWDFGPFRKVLASPVFHRWHHTHPDEGGSCNFAATFPVWDLMFGTWYMPEDRKPLVTGIIDADMPQGLVGQLLYPFRRPRGATAPASTAVAAE